METDRMPCKKAIMQDKVAFLINKPAGLSLAAYTRRGMVKSALANPLTLFGHLHRCICVLRSVVLSTQLVESVVRTQYNIIQLT